MATALATRTQLDDRMVGDTTGDTDRADAILADVSAAVRAWTGQTITQASTTDRLKVVGGRVNLPQRPATVVTTVADIDGNSVSYTWDGLQRLDVPSGTLSESSFEWGEAVKVVDVTYTHGYTAGDELDAVAGIVANVAARAWGTAPETGGRTQESIGAYSYSIGSASAAGGWGLLKAEKDALRQIVGGSRSAGTIGTEPLRSLP